MKRRVEVTQTKIGGELLDNVTTAYNGVQAAQYALTQAKEKYNAAVKTLDDEKTALEKLKSDILFEEEDLDEMRQDYDNLPPAAKLNKKFHENHEVSQRITQRISQRISQSIRCRRLRRQGISQEKQKSTRANLLEISK